MLFSPGFVLLNLYVNIASLGRIANDPKPIQQEMGNLERLLLDLRHAEKIFPLHLSRTKKIENSARDMLYALDVEKRHQFPGILNVDNGGELGEDYLVCPEFDCHDKIYTLLTIIGTDMTAL